MAGLGWLAARQIRARVVQGASATSPALAAGSAFAIAIGVACVFAISRSPLDIGAEDVAGLVGMSLVGSLGWAWLTASSRPAPAFTRSEIQWLITAPLPRRDLVAYRLAVTQPSVLGLSLVCAVASLPLGPAQSLRVGLSAVLLLELALVNQLFAACAHARLAAMGLSLVPRSLVALVVMLGGWTAVFWGAPPLPDASEDPVLALHWLGDQVQGVWGLASVAMLPVAGSPWLAVGLCLALIAALWVGILLVDGPFEEHALLAARPADRGRALFPLSGRGPLWRAFAWRGTTALARQAARAAPAIVILSVSVVFLVDARASSARYRELQIFAAFVFGLFALAPTFVQQDLHDDLRRTTWLYSLPVRTLDFVRGSVISGAAATWPVHVAITLTGALMVPSIDRFPDYTRPLVVPTLIVLEGACVYASFAVSNAMVAAWPGWLQHTGEESPGLENVGRLVGATALRNAFLLVALLPCAIAGAVPFVLLLRVDPRLGILAWGAISTTLTLLFAEWLVRRVARRLDARG